MTATVTPAFSPSRWRPSAPRRSVLVPGYMDHPREIQEVATFAARRRSSPPSYASALAGAGLG